MKKLILGWVVVTLSVTQFEAKSDYNFFNTIKNASKNIFLTSKNALIYVASCVRESNAVKIQKAFEAKKAVEQISSKLKIGIDGENDLLLNVHALEFDKYNATKSLAVVQDYCESMQVVVNRFQGVMTPWNRTSEMALAVNELLPYLHMAKMYKLYFEVHLDCLKGWELEQQYLEICSIDKNNEQEVVALFTKWFKNNGKDNYVKGVDELLKSVEWFKKQFLNEQFKIRYPQLYDQMYALFPALILFIEVVKKSNPYQAQLREIEQANRKSSGSSPSRPEEKVIQPVENVAKIENEKIEKEERLSSVLENNDDSVGAFLESEKNDENVIQSVENAQPVENSQSVENVIKIENEKVEKEEQLLSVSENNEDEVQGYWPKIFNDAEKLVDSVGKPF